MTDEQANRAIRLNPDYQTQQMFLDHGADSFLGEVISLVRVRRLHIDITPSLAGHGERVLIEFACILPDGSPWDTINSGRSYGEALRRVREALRFEVGR